MTADDQASGADISRPYYLDVVRPILEARWPALPHAAGRLGAGSDVLGLDDATSRDHDWGLRLSLLVADDLVGPISSHLEASPPPTYAGLPTRFAFTGATRSRHHIETTTLAAFLHDKVGLTHLDHVSIDDRLSLTGQSVLEVSAGPRLLGHGRDAARRPPRARLVPARRLGLRGRELLAPARGGDAAQGTRRTGG